jgi:transketolase
MDAIAPDLPRIDRRLSVGRLVAALPAGMPEALGLPLCFLFGCHLRFDSADPQWPDRDRLIVDAGLAPLAGTLASRIGLPENAFLAPGPAFGIGAGCALAERLLAARFGRSLVDHRSWVVAPSSDLATGAAQEAAWLAGTWRLGRLTVIVSVPSADAPGLAGFAAAGWSVRRIDGGAADEVAAAISAALRAQRPTLLAFLPPAHETPISGMDGSFATVEESATTWRSTGKRGAGVRRAWLKRLARHSSRHDFENAVAGRLPHNWYSAFFEPGPLLPPGQDTVSTSWTVRRGILRLGANLPELARLPADAAARLPAQLGEPAPIRDPGASLAEGLSSTAAGLALHGGVIPVSKHGLNEAGCVAASLSAAAASSLRTVTLLVEPDTPCPSGGQRAGLRAMRNLTVFRPADASEALECAELSLRRATGPSIMLVSESQVPLLADRPSRTRCAKGGYVLTEPTSQRAATLIASGPELHLALAASRILAAQGKPAAVVSLPCWSIFARQEAAWHAVVLGTAPRIGLEAGSGFGWESWLGKNGLFIGLDQMAGILWDLARPESAAHRIADLVLRHLCLRVSV